MKKIILPVLAVMFFVYACSKDQQVVNDLEGTWKITKATTNGVADADSTYSGITYKFEKCKVKDGDCNGTITEDGKSFAFTYKVSDKGKTLTMMLNFLGIIETTVATIEDNDGDKMVLVSNDEDGKHEVTAEKL